MRRIFCLLLALCLCLGFTCPALALSPGSEAENAAEALYELGLLRGTGTDADGKPIFELERTPNRYEALVMLLRLLGREEEALSGQWELPFTDVADWARPYVGCAWANGLTKGVSDTAFDGAAPVTAAQYLTFVLRALGYDSETDFNWVKAWQLTDKLGITAGEYVAAQAFTRGDLALVSERALTVPLKGTGKPLLSTLRPDGGLEVHFLDVGEADAALILCDGAAMLIDGGNAEDSSLLYAYLQQRQIDTLDYVVCTHPHEDHVGGLAGALRFAAAKRAFCSVTEAEGRPFQSFLKALEAQGVSLEVPRAGDSFRLGGARITVLGPTREGSSVNDNSLVLRLSYGNVSILFAADAERAEEQDILAGGAELKSTVLKLGHHGSNSSTTYPFLYAVEPAFAVISVGADNLYGHPAEDVLSRLRDAGVTTYRTDLQGTVICRSEGESVSFTVEKNPEADTLAGAGAGQNGQTLPEEGSYVLNTRTQVFHNPDCTSVGAMSERNKEYYTGSREELLAQGFRPCQNCRP